MTGPRRMRRIARGAASAIEREDGRPDPLRFLARLGCGWVPDHCAECVCLGAAPIIWLDWHKISRSDADLEDSVGPRGSPRRDEDRQREHSRQQTVEEFSHCTLRNFPCVGACNTPPAKGVKCTRSPQTCPRPMAPTTEICYRSTRRNARSSGLGSSALRAVSMRESNTIRSLERGLHVLKVVRAK